MTANMDMLNRAIAGWNAGDLDLYLTLYNDDIRLHGYTPQPMSKAEVTGFYRQIWTSLAEADRPVPGWRCSMPSRPATRSHAAS